MEKFQLLPFLTINGIKATSGLIYHEDNLFIISDSSTFLYQYHLVNKTFDKIKLFKESQENIAKKDKPDFESITLFNNQLYIYGSGATIKREIRVKYNLENSEIKVKKIDKFYKKLRDHIALKEDEINIEGVVINNENYYLFQRGNGVQAKNGIYTFSKKDKNVQFNSISLPKVKGIEATFTDAILVNEKVYFLAACENSSSTYLDGEIYGSFIGSLDLNTKAIYFVKQISTTQELEGLTLFKKSNNELEFLLCEDADNEELESRIYNLKLFFEN